MDGTSRASPHFADSTIDPPRPRRSTEPTADQQLEALFGDAEFAKLLTGAIAEVMRVWNIPHRTASGLVMSAVGEPKALASIHDRWLSAKATGAGLGLPRLIVRRRVFDLLRGDARRPHHESLPATVDEADAALGPADHPVGHDPHTLAELKQIVDQVHAALRSFAERGSIQARQAELLRCYALDELTHPELAERFACTEGALRVRIHKAMQALRRHIDTCRPELGELIERTGAARGS
jgi:DNA-directed RNA polymerase specialized sigma24 family protein